MSIKAIHSNDSFESKEEIFNSMSEDTNSQYNNLFNIALNKMKNDYDTIIIQKDNEIQNILKNLLNEKNQLKAEIESLKNEIYKLNEINKTYLSIESNRNVSNFYDNILERKKQNEKKSNKFEENYRVGIESLKQNFEEVKKKYKLNSFGTNLIYTFSDEESPEKLINEAFIQIEAYQKEILKLTEKNFENEKLILKLNFSIDSLKDENSFIKKTVIQEKEKLLNSIQQIKEQNDLDIQLAKNNIYDENFLKTKFENIFQCKNLGDKIDSEKIKHIFLEKDKIIQENVELFTQVNELNKQLEYSKNIINQVVQELEKEQLSNIMLTRQITDLKKIQK